MEKNFERIIYAPPGDGISSIITSNTSNLLLLSSWDSTARIYNISTNLPLVTFNFPLASLSCCFQNDNYGYAGGLDCYIHQLQIEKGSTNHIGSHLAPISSLKYSYDYNLLYSGSWDQTVGIWDSRTSSSPSSPLRMSGKVYSISLTSTRLVVATSDRRIIVYDQRNLSTPEQIRESPLRYLTRHISCFPNGEGFAIGSIEGRVAIEYFDTVSTLNDPSKNYAFKCHRKGDLAYPVNSIAFHPIYGTFATGGGDGTVSTWDGINKKKLCQYPQYPTSIASLAFNYDGTILAIASSYTFEEGEKPPSTTTTGLDDNVFLRTVNDLDVRPRPKTQ